MDSVNVAHDALLILFSAVLSCTGTIAVFSARMSVSDAKHNALAAQIERDRNSDKILLDQKFAGLCAQLETQERLQRAVLDIVANLARSSGVDRRDHTSDALLRFVTEDTGK